MGFMVYDAKNFNGDISNWNVTKSLFIGAEKYLKKGSILFLYGPFKKNGEHTSLSNKNFDEALKKKNIDWGVRNLEEVSEIAYQHNFIEEEIVNMPSNNLSIIYYRK